MFNWRKKTNEKIQEASSKSAEADFVTPEDKKKVLELAREKEAELEKLAKIDDEIYMVQRSTKTLVPFMAPLHNKLRMKYKWYYGWHLKRYSDLVHWLTLIAMVPLLTLSIFASLYSQNVPMTKATAAWYDASWSYRRALTIDYTKVDADLTGFPVEVSLSGLSNINADGSDIRFTSSDGTTELPRQIESYSAGTLVAWVKTNLSSSVDTTLYMYYGNAAATEPAADSTYGSQNVWDSNYAAVWHMNADANDSTVNAKNGTDHAITHGTSYGVAGGGLNTSNSSSGITIPTDTIGAIGTGDFTIEFWMNPVAPPASRYVYMAALFNSGASYTGPFMFYDPLGYTGHGDGLCVRLQTTSVQCITSPSASSLYGTWVNVVWNRISGVNTVYYDGVQKLQFTNNTSITAPSLGHIFGNYTGPPQPWAFNAGANGDEYRISTTGRSVEWVTTQYNNQSSPSTFLTAGAEEVPLFVPDAPTLDSVTSGDSQAVVYFSAPASDGGDAITGYTVTASPGGATGTGTSSPIIVAGLTNGTEYTFTVYATNGVGNSSESSASSAITPTSASWYNASWSNRRAVIIDHTKVPSDQTGFPLEISMTGLSGINANGTDIRFTSSDGTTELPREIEKYDSGNLIAWVKTDLSSSVDTTLYMYYGNAAATEPAADSTYGKNNVWDSNYKGVWHLADPTNPTDSTSNGHSGTNNGTSATTGKIGGGGSFDGSSFINAGTINLSGSSITMQAWVNASSFQSSWPYISSIMGAESGSDIALLRLGDTGLSNNLAQISLHLAGNTNAINGMDTSTWYLVTATADGTNIKIYLNSNQENSSGQSSSVVSNASFNIGSNSDSGDRYFSGIMDELTVATTARSADWITTQYNNQSSPSTFFIAGGEQVASNTTISGTIYTALDQSTNIGADKTVNLSINGGAAESTTTDANGAFSFSTSTALDTDYPVAVYLSGDTNKASYITVATDGSTDITDLALYTGHVSLSQENSTAMTNTLLATANTIADSDMLILTSAGTTTFTTGMTTRIVTGKTYTPGGNVASDNFQLYGTFIPESNNVNISGSWDATGGTLTSASSTFVFNSTATGKTVTSNSQSFNNLTFNGSGGGWTLSDDLTVAGALNVTTGTLDASSHTINLSGSGTPFTIAGTFTPSTGTVNYTGSSATNVTGITYYNLTLNHTDTTFTAAGDITVSNVLTVTAGTFDASSRTITLTGASGTPFVNSGTFTPSTSTVVFNTDTANVPFSGISTFNNLTLSPTLTASRNWTLPAVTVNGTSATSFDINPTAGSAYALTVTLGGNLALSNASTLLIRGTSSATSVLDTSITNYSISTGKLQINPGGSVTANGSTITLTGSSTPFSYWTSNAFSAGTSTIVFSGDADISYLFYLHNGDLSVNNVQISPTLTAPHTQALNSYNYTLTIGGTLVINPSSDSANLLTITNSKSIAVTGSTTVGGSGSATSTFVSSASSTFGAVTINSGDTMAPTASITVSSMTIDSGGTLTLATNTVTISGSGTPFVNNGTFTPSTGSTIIYTGSSDTTVAGTDYYNLNLNHADTTFTAGGNISIAGVLTINAGTFDASIRTITLSGTSGTPFIKTGTFTPSTSTIAVTGNYSSGNTGLPGGTYYNLILNNASETFSVDSSLTINNDLNITAGTFAPGQNISIYGSWTNAGSFTPSTNTVNFVATATGKTITSNGQSFYNLVFNGSGGGWTLQDNSTIENDITLTAGTVTAGATTITVGGNWTNDGGTFTYGTSTVDLTGDATIGGGGNFYNLRAGHDGTTVNFGSDNISIYNILYAYSGGTLTGDPINVYLRKTDGDPFIDTGVTITTLTFYYISPNSISVSGHDFYGVGFRGYNNDVTYTLTSDLSSDAISTFSDTEGKTTTLDTNSHNLAITNYIRLGNVYAGIINFSSGVHSTGSLGWTSPVASGSGFDLGSSSISVNNSVYFTDTSVTPGTSTVTMNATATGKTVTSNSQSFNNLTFNGSGGGWTLADDLTVNGALNVAVGTLDASSYTVNLAGSGTPLTIAGTFTPGTGTVNYTGSSTTNVAGTTYYNLTMNHSGVTFTVAAGMTVNNVLTVTAGTFDASSRTITLAGSGTPLVVNGTFSPSTSTIVYGGSDSTTQTVPGGLTFYNLTASTSSNSAGRTIEFTGGSTTTVNNALTLTGASDKILTVQSSDSSDYTINPVSVTASYADISYFVDSGSAFCATNSTDSGNNSGFIFSTGDSCPIPTAPSGLTGTAASTSEIDWTWTDNSDNELSWQVQDSSSNGVSSSLTVNTTSWNETSLSANTGYTRKVVATNTSGSSSSSLVTAYTLANTPSAPTLSATSANAINIVINTNSNPTTTTLYAIYNVTLGAYVKHADGSTQTDPDWQLYADWGGASGFDNTGLTAGTNYVYKVKAKNGDDIATDFSATANTNTGNPTIAFSSATASGSISTATVTVPISISGVSGTDATVDFSVSGGTATSGDDFTLADGTASISSGDSSTSFDITITNDHLVGSDKTIIVSLSNPTGSSLGANTTYTYTIVNDNVGPSGGFVINSTNPSRTNSRDLTLTLSYSLATQYKASLDSGFTDASWTSVAASVSQALADTDGTQTVYLKYKDAYGNESGTYNRSVVLDRVAPAVPTTLSVSAGNTAISLTWVNPTDSDFAAINIYRSTVSDFTAGTDNLLTTTTSASTATYTDSSVTNNTTYYYKIAGLDNVSNLSAASAQVSGRPDSDQPTTPGQPSITASVNTIDSALVANTKSVTFNWAKSTDENSGLKAYYINIGTASGTANILDSQEVKNDTTSYDYSFAVDGTYFVKVFARDNKNNLSAASPETTLIVDSTSPTTPTDAVMADVSNRADDYYAVILSWKPATDTGSGLKGYVVSRTGQAMNLDSNSVTMNISTDAKSGLISYLDILSADAKASYTIKAVDLAKNETAAVAATLSDTNMTKTTGQKVGSTEIILPSSIIGEGELAVSDIKVSSSATTNDKTQAEVTWLTSVPANSQVMYGASANYSLKTEIDTGLNSSHTVILSDLKPATTYHYKVVSIDQHSNTVSSGDQTFTTSGQIKQKTVLDIIADYVSNFFNSVYNAVKKVFSVNPDTALAAASTGPKSIYVTNISSPSQPGYAIYWPDNLGKVNLERSENGGAFSSVVQTERNFYSDIDVKADSTYTYRVGSLTASVSDAMSGKSIISDIKIKSGVVDKNSASVIVTFKTDKLAQSQILYGENGVMDSKTTLDESLNQSHTVLIKKLKVNTPYSFTLKAIDSSGQNTTDSAIQKYVTPKAPVDMSLFEIIINALESAFAGLSKIGK
ncbi:hypothetical protein COT78_03310 [Candidatus Berkelbacteria bacterium CG10_big_fil_rev_8_21_14_0_10_43_13]|uniref:Fibronectin type-III domain-containing protein n=1 Tax=Candidatus Berkelbacteria bacterium CG10_big_fil_rev_8_21_14_0_10_43_13 TaxID=1974514 RepID=A0A2H0W5V3_9BACT|nr:MAG: hypothetical protein COT78_03310 [Candidatus Berkelbacteria bacterium CG10_big_fil_rev_8_21_14_0_10_43_13]